MMKDLPETVRASYRYLVTGDDTADRWGNELPVLATPVLLWLGEITAMRAVEAHLDEGEMTVGLSHDSRHLAPTPPGRHVLLTAELRERDGNTLVFEVGGHDGTEEVLRGVHTRAVVDRLRFTERVTAKQKLPPDPCLDG